MNKKVYYKKRQQSQREINNYWKEFENCKKVLDLGCGLGSFGKYKPQGLEVYGIDADKNAIKDAKKYENTKLGDLNKKLPYKNTFFDGIFAKDIFEHLFEPWKLASECKRILKKNGFIIATVPSPGWKAWEDYTHVKPFTERSLRELFLDQGFEVEYVKRLRGIPGFGILGLNVFVPYILKIPIISWLTQGYQIKAVKK